jgi:hypothetical protein
MITFQRTLEKTRFTESAHNSQDKYEYVRLRKIYGNPFSRVALTKADFQPHPVSSAAAFCFIHQWILICTSAHKACGIRTKRSKLPEGKTAATAETFLVFKLLLQYILFPAAVCLAMLSITQRIDPTPSMADGRI